MDIIASVQKSAGKIWKALESRGPLQENKLIWGTKLENNLFYGAIGWLARENKINKENDVYKLGETNLTLKIGKDAGKVWRVLDTWGEVDVPSISRLARIDEKDVFFAIGWLAKEEKIEGRVVDTQENKISFWLK